MTPTNNKLKVQDVEINIRVINEADYISLTDMTINQEQGSRLIEKWLTNKNTIEYLGVWEELSNPNFNSPEFGGIKNEAGVNRFYSVEKRFKILVETIKEQRAVLDKVDYLKSIKKLSNETYTSIQGNKQLDKQLVINYLLNMKHLFILFLLLSTNAFAQGPLGDYAVVKDKDGYVNIRAKENVKSKIVGTLPNNTLVYGFFDKEFNPTNWIEVDKGYVHQSRLKKIFDFRAIEGKVQGNSLVFDDKDVKVTITKQKFDKTKHKITKKDQGSYDQLIIDGKEIYGIEAYGGDDSLPEDHYKSITVTMKGKNVPIPKSAYDDLHGILYDRYLNRFIYYDEEAEALYIYAFNGDASLAYQVCWQIVKGEYITRIIE